MKIETFNELYKNALDKLEKEKLVCEDAEIVLVPIIIGKKNGKVGSISSVETSVILKMENQFLRRMII